MDKLAPYLASIDLTTVCYLLTWSSTLLALALTAKTSEDPASTCVGCWCQRFRRLGMVLVQLSLLSAILFGESLKWVPWPPMFVLLVGLNVYYAASITAVQERIAVYRRRSVLHPGMGIGL